MADNAALLAEIEAVRESLTAERAHMNKLLYNYDCLISADQAVIEEYKRANLVLTDKLGREVRASKEKRIGGILLGAVIGALAGMAAR